MADLSQVHRVVFRHDWMDISEWADALGQLADLTDDEIDGVTTADFSSNSVVERRWKQPA